MKSSRTFVWGLVLIFAVTFSILALNRHDAFRTNGFDLGNVNQALWNTAQGRPLAFTNMAPVENRLALHVEPILFLLLPFYWLGLDGPRLLLVVQAMVVGLGAWPLYLIARSEVGSIGAAVISLAYLLYPALEAAVMYDFHAATLAPTLLLFAFYRLELSLREPGRSWKPFILFAALAMACKEDMGFVVGMMGVYVWLVRRRWRPALAIIGAGFGWSLIALLGVQSFFGGNVQSDRYDWLIGALFQPLLIWDHLWRQADLGSYLWGLFAPVMGLALLSPLALLPMLPSLAVNLLSNHGLQWRLEEFHYAAPVAPFVFIATAQGLGWLNRKLTSSQNSFIVQSISTALLIGLLVAALSYHYWRGFSPLARPFRWYTLSTHQHLGTTMAAEIDPNLPLFAPLTLNPHISSRRSLHQTFDTIAPDDWLWLDVTALPNENDIQTYIRDTLLSGYVLIQAQDGYLLLEPGSSGSALPLSFYTFVHPGPEVSPEYPISVFFGQDLELVGYDLIFNRAEEVEVTTYWLPHANLPAELTPVLYLLDETGSPLGATEPGKPPATLVWYPVERWTPGEIVRVHFNLLNWDTRSRVGYDLGLGVLTSTDPFNPGTRRPPTDIRSDFANRLTADGTLLNLAHIRRLAGLPEGGPLPRLMNSPAVAHGLSADFNGQIRLLGYGTLRQHDGQLTLTLYWQALASPLPDYTRFVHVVAGGALQAQLDSRPVYSTYPTRLWQNGEYIVDPVTISLNGSLSADYMIHVGFYDPATLQRLPTNVATPDYVLISPQ